MTNTHVYREYITNLPITCLGTQPASSSINPG
ncbi:hypothetical protein YPF_0960 [Yersinia pestis biovar Orientalis str. India 195]|nr:hypothetical protein YPF_0960 [Yersinia pestis biovar Orientalis str. India 195]